jgi:hypothetical protein
VRTMAVKQTAGRAQLGEFAPKFAQLNENKTRCLIQFKTA